MEYNTPAPAVTPATNPDVQAIQNNVAIIQQLPAILQGHQLRTSKALTLGEQLLEEFMDNAHVMTEALFQKFKAYIIKCNDVGTELENNRKPGTQSFDLIRRMFTNLERLIDVTNKDSVPYKMQQLNNQFLKDEQDRKQKEDAERERKIKKGQEEISIRANLKLQIGNALLNHLGVKKSQVQDHFNKITLEDFETKSNGLRNMPTDFPLEKITEVVKIGAPIANYHTADEINLFLQEEWKVYPWQEFRNQYTIEIGNLKISLIAQLQAKKTELENIASANKAEAERLIQVQKDREADQQRQQELLLEQQKQQQASFIKQQETTGHIQTLFKEQPAVSAGTAAEAKKQITITVNNHAGIVEIFTAWFERLGAGYTVEDIMNKKLDSMKTDLQNEAKKKDGFRIAGTNVTYSEGITSVNRKPVVK